MNIDEYMKNMEEWMLKLPLLVEQFDIDVINLAEECIEGAYSLYQDKLRTNFINAVNKYYADYKPKHPENRTYSLKNALILDDLPTITTEYNGKNFDLDFSFTAKIVPDETSAFRSGYRSVYNDDGVEDLNDFDYLLAKDDLFYQSFVLGWHGGAGSGDNHPAPDNPYWRTPYKKFTRWMDKPAPVTSPAPFFLFTKGLMNSKDFQIEFDKLYLPKLNKLVERFKEQVKL